MSKLAVVNCYFAKRKISVHEHYADICDAVAFARCNLLTRYNIKIVAIKETMANSFILKILIPDEMYETFSYGKHLRGISAYLLRKHPEKYEPLKSGSRLLYYVSTDTSVL